MTDDAVMVMMRTTDVMSEARDPERFLVPIRMNLLWSDVLALLVRVFPFHPIVITGKIQYIWW